MSSWTYEIERERGTKSLRERVIEIERGQGRKRGEERAKEKGREEERGEKRERGL